MKYTFKELIDVPKLQELTDELYTATSIPSAIVAMDGEIITGSGWQKICTDFHRKHPQIEKECIESDTIIRKKLDDSEPFVIYKCPRGMVDASSPIIIAGEHVANVFSGQVFLESCDETTERFFREQARKFGFDEAEYIKAFKKVPIFEEEKFRAGISFLAKLAQSITDNGLTRLRELEAMEALRESEELHKEAQRVAHIGHWELYPEIGTPVWSDEIFRIFGLNPQEKGPSFTDLETHLHPDDWPLLNKAATLTSADGAPLDITFRIVRPDGEIRWMHAIWTTTKDEKGKVTKLFGTAQDITDLKQSEAALKKSEEKFRTFTEMAPVGVFVTDADGLTTYWNKRLCEITGMQVVEGLGTGWADGVHPDDRERVFKEWYESAEKRSSFSCEYRFVDRDGAVTHTIGQASPLTDASKQVTGYVGTITDVTDLKQAEEALRESEEKYKALFSNAQVALFRTRISDGKLVQINEKYAKMAGYSTVEDCMAEFNAADAWANPNARNELLRILKENGSVNDFETEIIRRDGSPIWILFSATIFPEQGFLEGSTVDINERKQAEDALRESEEKYRRIFENIQDVYYDASLDGTILEISPSIENVSQYKRKELIGKSLYGIYTDPKERDEFLKLILDKGKVSDFEISLTDKDGSKHPCSITTLLVKDEKGNPIKLVGSMRDISERKQIEDERKKFEGELQQAQKMESIGTLAGGIAHDFNNLLMAIQGRTSIMLTKKESSHPDIRHLKGIEDNVESAADLTRQLLGFARGGKYVVKPTNLNELVKKENRMFGRTKKQISIRGKYEKDLWSVEVDRGQIEQVLLNLYVNAWQSMPAGGDLYLETENVTLDENYVKPFSIEPGKYVKISVTDTGTGMDKATQEKIFEPFFTTKEMGRGTGLGLASAYGIIKNHHGFINVYSEKGHGTTFNIYLPASEKEIIEEKKPAGDTLRGFETILFVDDEDMIIEVAEEMFEQLGYKLLIARSGKEAIETYEKNKELIDIVLLDMIMPDMSGSDTYDRMKELDPDIKVLLASGYSINGTATEILDRGCSGFIQKPFKMQELSQKLREILDDK